MILNEISRIEGIDQGSIWKDANKLYCGGHLSLGNDFLVGNALYSSVNGVDWTQELFVSSTDAQRYNYAVPYAHLTLGNGISGYFGTIAYKDHPYPNGLAENRLFYSFRQTVAPANAAIDETHPVQQTISFGGDIYWQGFYMAAPIVRGNYVFMACYTSYGAPTLGLNNPNPMKVRILRIHQDSLVAGGLWETVAELSSPSGFSSDDALISESQLIPLFDSNGILLKTILLTRIQYYTTYNYYDEADEAWYTANVQQQGTLKAESADANLAVWSPYSIFSDGFTSTGYQDSDGKIYIVESERQDNSTHRITDLNGMQDRSVNLFTSSDYGATFSKENIGYLVNGYGGAPFIIPYSNTRLIAFADGTVSTPNVYGMNIYADRVPDINIAFFSVQPEVQSITSDGGSITYSTNELHEGSVSEIQKIDAESISAFTPILFVASISASQSKQTSLVDALEIFQSSVAQAQIKQTESASSLLTFAGSSSQAQNKNVEASLASLNFAGSVNESQLKQQESSSLALFFTGTIAELQALQTEALTGTIATQGVFVGSVNQLQNIQAESVLSAESFEGFISEVQLSQAEAVAVIQAFQGVAQSQKVQAEAGTGQLLFVGIVSQSQRLQSEFALDITPVIVKNASTVYASQIESAKRQIKAKGASVVWRSPHAVVDESKPWKVTASANVDNQVSIVFDIVTGSNKSSRYLKDTNVEIGTEIGYMASVDFEPNLGDVVIRNGKELSVKNINTIQPDGNPILHIIEFAK